MFVLPTVASSPHLDPPGPLPPLLVLSPSSHPLLVCLGALLHAFLLPICCVLLLGHLTAYSQPLVPLMSLQRGSPCWHGMANSEQTC